jgi:DNA-directed RNA polymerase subunit alpha
MLNFEPFASDDVPEDGTEPLQDPTIEVEEADEQYGKFVAGPLPKGYGMTLGNPLRRVLYSSLPGTAVTSVKIEGVLHEYATIPHVKEEVSEILLNIKGVRLRSEVDRPGKLRLEVAGRGEICAGDIMASSDYEVVNPELHIATLDSEQAKLSVEFNVERGTSYKEAEGEGLPIGVLPVDAIYGPVRKVRYYTTENIRVGQRTDLERLTIEVWTDGSISPIKALQQAGNELVTRFFLFANAERVVEGDGAPPVALQISPEMYSVPVEKLDLSSRTLNCLKRAGLDQVGHILEMKPDDLLEIRNFGEKSLHELYDRLRESNLLPPALDPELERQDGEDEPAEEPAEVVKEVEEKPDEDDGDIGSGLDAVFSQIEGLGDNQ